MKNKHSAITAQGTMLFGYCAVCNTPIFFSWEERKRALCSKCSTLNRLIKNDGRKMLAAIIAPTENPITCLCGNIVENSNGIFKCSNCNRVYYSRRAKLIERFNRRMLKKKGR